MTPGSARRTSIGTPCAFQYCRIMEMAADPHPSSLCLTNGTSSQTPAVSGGAASTGGPRKSVRNKTNLARFERVTNNSDSRELVQRQRQDNDPERDHNNPQHIAVGDASRGKIGLSVPGTLRQLSEVFVTQLANRLVHPLVIDLGGFERLLALVGRKQCSYRLFIRLPGLGRPGRVFAEFTERNDVWPVLRPRRSLRRYEQSGHPQHKHTPFEARMHPSSCCWLG